MMLLPDVKNGLTYLQAMRYVVKRACVYLKENNDLCIAVGNVCGISYIRNFALPVLYIDPVNFIINRVTTTWRSASSKTNIQFNYF